MTTGKSRAELTQIADDALRSQPGCETASVPAVRRLPNIREGRNWEIPNVDSRRQPDQRRRPRRDVGAPPAWTEIPSAGGSVGLCIHLLSAAVFGRGIAIRLAL